MRFDRDEFNTTPSSKEALRRQIARDVADFLDKGGVIEVIPPGQSDFELVWDSIFETWV